MLKKKKSTQFTIYTNTAIVLGIIVLLLVPGPATALTQIEKNDADLIAIPHQKPIAYTDFKLDTSTNQNGIILSYELPKVRQTLITNEYGKFTRLEIPESTFTNEPGKPQLPQHRIMLAVPTNSVSLTILDAHIADTRTVGRLYPVQEPLPEGYSNNEVEFEYDEPFYNLDITYPSAIVQILRKGSIRDIPFISVGVNPIQYNPKKATATIYDKITIQVTWSIQEPLLVDNAFKHTPFYPFYENIFANWNDFIDCTYIIETEQHPLGGPNTGCEYLIITHPAFESAAQTLATWKDKRGILTKIVNTQKTGSTARDIREYIQMAYDTWIIRPSYVLLIGDVEYIPTNYLYIHPYHGAETASDIWYVTVEGSDYYPDMFIGRISVDTVDQVNIIIQKIIDYEKTPPSHQQFYHNITLAAYFQDRNPQDGYEDRRFVKTSEEIRDYLLPKSYNIQRIYYTEEEVIPTNYNDGTYANGEPLPPELLKPGFAWDGDHHDITDAIQQGSLILNHRDHGFTYGWGDPYYDISHIQSLSNKNLLPIVFSINCCSGQFDTDDDESFCEEFIRKNNGGAIGVIGASRVSYSGYNDYLCRGFYDAIWPDFDPTIGGNTSLYTMGQVLNYGKSYMANTWGSQNTYERITFEMFHWFGDPTMEIWTAIPQNLMVDHPVAINSSEGVVITVTDTEEHPIEGAMVCISNDRIYGRGLTDSKGVARFETIEIMATAHPNSIEHNASIVVSIHNYIPYEAVITASMELLGDINADGVVNILDLFLLLISWGANPRYPADLDGNGVVNFRDLFIFIINWE